MKIVVLGGAGYFSRSIIKEFSDHLGESVEIVLADYNYRLARKMAKKLGHPFSARMVNIEDDKAFDKCVEGSGLIVSMAGPWYKMGEKLVSGALRNGKPLLVTNLGVSSLPESLEKEVDRNGGRIITGLSIFPGLTDLLSEKVAGKGPHLPLSIDTGKYGGLDLIREYFSILGKHPSDKGLIISGFFQKKASTLSPSGEGFRVELCATLQETFRKKPVPGNFQAVTIFSNRLKGEVLVSGGHTLKNILLSMLVSATEAAPGLKKGVHYFPDIYEELEGKGMVERELKLVMKNTE